MSFTDGYYPGINDGLSRIRWTLPSVVSTVWGRVGGRGGRVGERGMVGRERRDGREGKGGRGSEGREGREGKDNEFVVSLV